MRTTERPWLLIPALVFTIIAAAQPDSWSALHNYGTTGPTSPPSRYDAMAFSIGTKGYICGGATRNDLWEYDQSTGTWTQRASIPNAGSTIHGGLRSSAVAFSIGTSGYVGTGALGMTGTATNDFWEFQPAGNVWVQRANFSGGPRTNAVGFSVGSKGYIGTGNNQFGASQDDLWEYDPGTDAWTPRANVPGGGRYSAVAVSLGTKAYVGTGLIGPNHANDFWEYDPTGDTWTPLAPMNSDGRFEAVAFTYNGLCYVGTGTTLPNNTTLDNVEAYDPVSDSWALAPLVPGGTRQQALGLTIGTKGYIGTGYGHTPGYPEYADMHEFDGTWTTLPEPVNAAVHAATGFAVGGKGYVVGGVRQDGNLTAECWEYDPGTDSWSQKANYAGGGRRDAVGFAIGAKGYVGTGNNFFTFYSDLWAYDPGNNTWTACTSIPTSGRKEGYAFVINGKGYIGGGLTSTNQEPGDLWQYDPVADSWTLKAGITNGAYNATAFVLGPLGYVCNPAGILRAFDPVANTWTNKQSLYRGINNERHYAVAFAIGGRGVVSTGEYAGGYYKDVWEYSPAQDTWAQRADMSGPARSKAVGFVIDDVGYLSTGIVLGGYYLNDLWRYEPQEDQTCNAGNPVYCLGYPGNYVISNVLGYRAPGNIYTAELSDNSGSFATPIPIGTFAGTASAAIECTVPLGLPLGGGYHIRIVSSDPVYIGPPSPSEIWLQNTIMYYSDADGDGFGYPSDSLEACYGQPPFYAPNTLDDCPFIFGRMGDPCFDGVFPNYGDTITDQCECRGGNPRTLEMHTGANGAQITWDIVRPGENNILRQGPATPYADNAISTETIFLHDGCYQLRVHDSGGDGMGIDGGYLLHDENGKLIISNLENGVFGSLSTIGAEGFCVPVGNDQLTPNSANKETWLAASIIQVLPDPAVSAEWGVGDQTDDGYQFWLFDPNGSYSRRVLRNHATSGSIAGANALRATKLQISTINTNPVPADVLLNVRVRSLVNGQYGDFGPASRFRMLSTTSCPLTKLEDEGAHFSCGGYYNLTSSQKVWAKVVTRPAVGGGTQVANKYQFEWSDPDHGYLRTIATTTPALVLSVWGTNPLIPCRNYNVRVRASFDNGVNYCPWGPSCGAYIYNQQCFPGFRLEEALAGTAEAPTLLVYPNPNSGEQFAVSMSGIAADLEVVHFVVFDAYGKEVLARELPADGGTAVDIIHFDTKPATGVYAVSITAGEETFMQRLVIQ
ncbi:MAG: T9SS type A sorting domain-containing protein [Flavobacteriales bacterium]